MTIESTNDNIPTTPAITYSTCYRLPFLSLFHADCMEIMKDIEDGTIDLIVTDPPYEIEDMKPYFAEMLRCLSKDGSIYVFGNKNMIAEHWFSQLKIDSKELLVCEATSAACALMSSGFGC